MEENKNEILEEVAEAVEETVEEIVEDVVATEEETAQAAVDVDYYVKKINSLKAKNRVLAVILALVILAVAGFTGYKAYVNYNPYNNMGIPNTSSMTLLNVARMYGVSVDELKEQYQLPEDVKDNTYYDVVQYITPTSVILQMSGMDFEAAKEQFKFSDDVTPETLWWDAEATIPVSVYFGTGDMFEELKKEYGLDESVTEDTPWGEVREHVLMVDYEKANAPAEVVEEEPETVLAEDGALTEEEMAEIMAQLENATEIAE